MDNLQFNQEDIRQIIREEMSMFLASDRYIFQKLIQLLDGRNIQLGKTTGTKIGTAIDQLLGFYGTTPVNKPETVSDANTQGAAYNEGDVQSIADAVNAIIDRLQELGLIK